MLITDLFVIAKNQKHSTCPLTGECINNLCYIYVVEYSLVIKNN